jgi:hypothetical protein
MIDVPDGLALEDRQVPVRGSSLIGGSLERGG